MRSSILDEEQRGRMENKRSVIVAATAIDFERDIRHCSLHGIREGDVTLASTCWGGCLLTVRRSMTCVPCFAFFFAIHTTRSSLSLLTAFVDDAQKKKTTTTKKE